MSKNTNDYQPVNVTSQNVTDMCQADLLTTQKEQALFARLTQVRKEIHILENLNGQSTDETLAQLRELRAEHKRIVKDIIEANGRLVINITKKYLGWGVELADLNQEGELGLLKAIEKFDPARGYKFSTYATWWVRQAVTRTIADQGRMIRLPVHMTEKVSNLYRAEIDLQKRLGREPDSRELAQAMDITPERIVWLREIGQHTLSLEQEQSDYDRNDKDGDNLHRTLSDDTAISPPEATDQSLLGEVLDNALETLPPREARILRLRFGILDGRAHTLEEVGQKFGVTRERIRQLEGQALKKLRHPRRARVLREFLEA